MNVMRNIEKLLLATLFFFIPSLFAFTTPVSEQKGSQSFIALAAATGGISHCKGALGGLNIDEKAILEKAYTALSCQVEDGEITSDSAISLVRQMQKKYKAGKKIAQNQTPAMCDSAAFLVTSFAKTSVCEPRKTKRAYKFLDGTSFSDSAVFLRCDVGWGYGGFKYYGLDTQTPGYVRNMDFPRFGPKVMIWGDPSRLETTKIEYRWSGITLDRRSLEMTNSRISDGKFLATINCEIVDPFTLDIEMAKHWEEPLL